jgi:hypothetical protein
LRLTLTSSFSCLSATSVQIGFALDSLHGSAEAGINAVCSIGASLRTKLASTVDEMKRDRNEMPVYATKLAF